MHVGQACAGAGSSSQYPETMADTARAAFRSGRGACPLGSEDPLSPVSNSTPEWATAACSATPCTNPRYADRWVDFLNGIAIVGITMLVGWNVLAGLVLVAVMVVSSLASTVGTPIAGRSAAAASTARARFGRSLVSALDAARTVKLAAATPAVHRYLQRVDGGRVTAAVREHRVQAMLDGVPIVMVQCGVVAGWLVYLAGGWGLATALLVTTAVNGFDWFGRVAGSVITEAPGGRACVERRHVAAGRWRRSVSSIHAFDRRQRHRSSPSQNLADP